VELALDGAPPSGRVSVEHVINVLARPNAAPRPANVETALQVQTPSIADTARCDRLRHIQEAGYAGRHCRTQGVAAERHGRDLGRSDLNAAKFPSPLATAIGVAGIVQHGKRGRFYSTVDLVNALEREKAQGKAGRIAASMLRLDAGMKWHRYAPQAIPFVDQDQQRGRFY
jgi:hypothetical protein